ncbi:hypothetical protein MBLNU459_g2361t1 [Dothideomycetes sp. NU459]
MIAQPSVGTQRPPVQRVPSSSSSSSHRPLNRPALPSKLSNVLAPNPDPGAGRSASRQAIIAGPGPDQSAAQPVIIDLDDDASNEDAASARNSSAHAADGLQQYAFNTPQDRQHHVAPYALQKQNPLPLPPRPAFLAESHHSRPAPCRAATRTRRDPARKADGLRPPAVATALPGGRVADFFPWTGAPGMHSEDVLTDHTIKSGYSDKPPGPNQAESNIARPTIWPSLKNKSGLHILSALFCQVMDKRQAMGRCTDPSTFKPPPRVTLTDTKREAWLKDLANPDVPLRKLSRTIPHGIRGKGLLDHCIAKDIPMTRALWLSKCVGANEIRAFKRKGVSGAAALAGENKWTREWTISVEQFVEGVIASCGSPGWNEKMNYAIRLATHFYSEHLLDAEHYMDWLLNSLETSTSERLPIWILLTQIYWKHLVTDRRRGRKLSEALLAHALALADLQHAGVNTQLVTRLHQLITILAVAHQGCLVLPQTWHRYKHIFSAIKPAGKYELATGAMQNVVRRNDRLNKDKDEASSIAAPHNVKLELLDILDSVGFEVQINDLAPRCSNLRLAFEDIITTVLEWACSRHRCGLARIYLAAHLLRYWNDHGIDTDDSLLRMLERTSTNEDYDLCHLHKIVTALSQSGHFSVGRYLQWLISMGASSASPTTSVDAQLLLELPTVHLSSHVMNLRRTLLSRMGISVDSEMRQIESYQDNLSRSLENLTTSSMSPPSMLSGTVKLAIAQWLCHRFIATSNTGQASFVGSLNAFCTVRHVLERFEDYVSLAKIVDAGVSSTDAHLLAAISDTVNLNLDIFAAMGVSLGLITRMCIQQHVLRTRQPLDRTLLLSLSSLVKRVPSASVFVKTLATDLAICEMQGSAAACSPASDNMVISIAGSLESDVDIDRVLASGNTMDEQLMARTFGLISSQVAKLGTSIVPRASAWFAQLRLFDQPTFDLLSQTSIAQMCDDAAQSKGLCVLAAALVGAGCLKIDVIFRAYERKVNSVQSTNGTYAGELATACTRMMAAPQVLGDTVRTPETYRFDLAKALFCEDHKRDVLRSIRLALSVDPSLLSHSVAAIENEELLPLLGSYVVTATDVVAHELVGRDPHSPARSRVQNLLDVMLGSGDAKRKSEYQAMARINDVVFSADELSLKICQLVIQQYSLTLQSNGMMKEEDKNDLIQTFQTAINADSSVWPALLGALDKDMVSQIHDWAQERLINSTLALISATTAAADYSTVRRYLKVWEVSASAAQLEAPQTQAFSVLNEHLRNFGSLAESIYTLDTTPSGLGARISFGIGILLQLVTTHYQALDNGTSAAQELIPLLTVLCSLLVHPKLQTQLHTLEHVLDVTSMISDDVPMESLQSIVKQFPAFARNNSRVRYLFGSANPPDSWLVLASRIYSQLPGQQANNVAQSSSLPRPPSSLPPRPGSVPQRPTGVAGSTLTQQQGQQRPTPTSSARGQFEIKTQPFHLKRWEIMPDPTPNMGPNDTSLSLGLFQARKCA